MRAITLTPQAPATRTPSVFTTATPRNDLAEKMIFDDTLDANWSLDNSKGTKFDLKATTPVKSGSVAIAVTPQTDFGTLYFTVRPDAKENYPRDHVWGVSVWINGGANLFGPEDLALTIVGSNASPFWVADDKSVVIDDKRFFSETRLYYLGVTRQVPANTWLELVMPLDRLPYDPDYKYVTGIYLKNDAAFKKNYSVDRVALILIK